MPVSEMTNPEILNSVRRGGERGTASFTLIDDSWIRYLGSLADALAIFRSSLILNRILPNER